MAETTCPSPAFVQILQLFRRLDVLITTEEEESSEANRIREEAEPLWYQLTAQEQEQLRAGSGV